MYKILNKLKPEEIKDLTGLNIRGNFITRKIDGAVNKIKICIPVDPSILIDKDKGERVHKYISAFGINIAPNDRYNVGMEITRHFGFLCIHIAFLNNLVDYERTNLVLAELITGLNTFGEKEIEYAKTVDLMGNFKDLSVEEFNELVKPYMDDKKMFFIVEHNNPDLILDVEVNDEFNFNKDVKPLSENTGYMVGNEEETLKMWIHLMSLVFIFNFKDTSTFLIKDNKLLIAVTGLDINDKLSVAYKTIVSDIKTDKDLACFINSLLTSYLSDEEELIISAPHRFIEKYMLFDTPYIVNSGEFVKFMTEAISDKEILDKFITIINGDSVTEIDMDNSIPS